jgi:hypothetical protein
MNCSVVPWIASKMVLTLEKRVLLVDCFFLEKGNIQRALENGFLKKNPETTVPNRHTVRALIAKFHETSSVFDIKRSG